MFQSIVMYEWIPIWLKVTESGEIFNMDDYPYEGGRNNTYKGKCFYCYCLSWQKIVNIDLH